MVRASNLAAVLADFTYRPIPLYELFGFLSLSLHGVFAALGFVAGSALAVQIAGRRGYDKEAFLSMFNWALIGAILGARYLTIGAQIADGATFTQVISPIGNFSIIGGFLGGIAGAAIQARRLRQPFLPLVDSTTFGLAVGTIVGRLGDLAIAEHLGSATDFVLGYAVLPGYDLAPQHTALECSVSSGLEVCGVYHPTWLYDLLGAVVLLGVLTFLVKRWKGRRYGQMFSVWVAWYGLQRFLIDFTRQVPADQGLDAANSADAVLGPFTWSQWSGVLMVVVGIGMFRYFGMRNKVVSDEEDHRLAAAAGRQPASVES